MVTVGSDAALDDPIWLENLSNHAIFSPQEGGHRGRRCMVVRNSDLLVANGKVLRTTSLLDAKHNNIHHDPSSSPSSTSSSSSSSTYKELVSDSLDFDIVELILNPSGKLLAVVGTHKIVIVVLPRPGVYSSKSVGSLVQVKAAAVGSYYYHDRIGGRAKIASVKWHPWGQLGSSLLIMSRDGLLREFDVSTDVEEPAQTVSLLSSSFKPSESTAPHSKSRSRSKLYRSRSRSQTPTVNRSIRSTARFALDADEDNSEDDYMDEVQGQRNMPSTSSHAVTFTFGIDERAAEDRQSERGAYNADWNALTIYTLCGNGDVYAICPFMPKNASMPLSYIHALSALVSLESSDNASNRLHSDRDMQTRYLTSLLKQARSNREGTTASPGDSNNHGNPDTRGPVAPGEYVEEGLADEVISLRAPPTTMIPQPPRIQGPFLLSPAPIELSEDRENTATDLLFARISSGPTSLDVLGVVGDDGRVDLCLCLELMEPNWLEAHRTPNRSRKVSSTGRYALSDTDSDEEGQSDETNSSKPLPTLFVYETIDLGIGNISGNFAPRFVLDPLYSDSIYIQHAKGAHAISIGRWSKELLTAMSLPDDLRQNAMERILHKSISSDLVKVVETSMLDEGQANGVVGMCIVSDIYLSYSFLALTQSGALVALELGLRVENEDLDLPSEDASVIIKETTNGAAPAAYTSLLGDGPPFTPPEPFQLLNGLPYHPRKAIKDKQSSAELRVTTETLRALATVVSTLRGEMRKIVQGGNVVQSRLELQIKELHRQLGKLNEGRKRLEDGKQRETRLDLRIKSVMDKQSTLVKRSDRLLQKLVVNHSPEVSIYEARWFKELQRLQQDVGKKEKAADEEGGLCARVSKLQYQLDILRPDLEKMKEEKATRESSELMGAKQLQSIESLLAKEAQLLATDRDMITHIQTRMQRHTMY